MSEESSNGSGDVSRIVGAAACGANITTGAAVAAGVTGVGVAAGLAIAAVGAFGGIVLAAVLSDGAEWGCGDYGGCGG